jgi:hypothetical protein
MTKQSNSDQASRQPQAHNRTVSRERRALAAFLVLAAVATAPAIVLRAHSGSGAAAQPVRIGLAKTPAPSRETSEARVVSARMSAGRAAIAARDAAGAATRHGDPAQGCTDVPRYPTALLVEEHRHARLIGAIATVPRVPPVTEMERFSLGKSAWLGEGGLPTVFGFYSARMRGIGFAAMSSSTRRVIGVRPTGSVDSPPLLYANRTGAALVQGSRSGVVHLTLFCGPVEL